MVGKRLTTAINLLGKFGTEMTMDKLISESSTIEAIFKAFYVHETDYGNVSFALNNSDDAKAPDGSSNAWTTAMNLFGKFGTEMTMDKLISESSLRSTIEAIFEALCT